MNFLEFSLDLSGVVTTITSMVTNNLPTILTLLGISVGIPFVVRLLKRVAR